MQYPYDPRDPQPFAGPTPGGAFTPPFGPPVGGPTFGPPVGGPPFGQPGGSQPSTSGPPAGPPPAYIPSQTSAQQTFGALAINPGAIRPCLFRYVYLWLDNGDQFWAWLVFAGSRSVSGWRWAGFRWFFFGIDTRRIVSFVCV